MSCVFAAKNITDEAKWKSFICGEELALDADGVLNNLVDFVLAGLVDQVPEHEAGLASSGSGCVLGIDSLERPLRLLHDRGEGVYGVEELVSVLPALDVAGVDVEALKMFSIIIWKP